MKISIVSMFFISLLIGCASYKNVKFQTDTFKSAGNERKFEMALPRGYSSVSSDELEPDILKQFEYPESGVIYISLDITYSNSPNKENWLKCSSPEEGEKCQEG